MKPNWSESSEIHLATYMVHVTKLFMLCEVVLSLGKPGRGLTRPRRRGSLRKQAMGDPGLNAARSFPGILDNFVT